MPFPFLPGGAILAAAVLCGAFVSFAALLRLLDRAATEIGGAMLPGVVDGLRDWSHGRGHERAGGGSPSA